MEWRYSSNTMQQLDIENKIAIVSNSWPVERSKYYYKSKKMQHQDN